MHVCMLCKYVCMYVGSATHGCDWSEVCVYVCMHVGMYACMYAMYVCMYVCMLDLPRMDVIGARCMCA